MPSEVEDQLLPLAATSSPEDLRDEVKRREADADGDRLLRDEQAARRRRSVRSWRRDDGMYEGRWLLDPVTGEYVDTMLRAFEVPDPAGTPVELRRSPEQRRADALAQAAQVALDAGAAPEQGGTKPHVSIVVPLDTLTCDADIHGELSPACRCVTPAEAEWAGPISRDALQRFLCDATLARVVITGRVPAHRPRPRHPQLVRPATPRHRRDRRRLSLPRLRPPRRLDPDPPRPVLGEEGLHERRQRLPPVRPPPPHRPRGRLDPHPRPRHTRGHRRLPRRAAPDDQPPPRRRDPEPAQATTTMTTRHPTRPGGGTTLRGCEIGRRGAFGSCGRVACSRRGAEAPRARPSSCRWLGPASISSTVRSSRCTRKDAI